MTQTNDSNSKRQKKSSESGTANKASHLSFREVLERGQGDADDLLRGGGGNLPTETPDAIRSSTVESIGKEGGGSGSESRMGGGVQAARPAWDVSIHTAANSNVQAGSRPRPESRILSHLTTQSNRLIANTRQLAPKHREEPLDDLTALRDLIHAQGKTPPSTKQKNPRVHTHERGKKLRNRLCRIYLLCEDGDRPTAHKVLLGLVAKGHRPQAEAQLVHQLRHAAVSSLQRKVRPKRRREKARKQSQAAAVIGTGPRGVRSVNPHHVRSCSPRGALEALAHRSTILACAICFVRAANFSISATMHRRAFN